MADVVLGVEARLTDLMTKKFGKIEKEINKFADTSKKAMKKAESANDGFNKSVSKIAKSALSYAAVTMAINRLARAMNQTIELYRQQETAERKLASALRSTGNAVGLSIEEMIKYSQEMQTLTSISDSAVIEAQALMVTFTKVGKEIFPTAIEAAADMSVMFGQSLQQSIIQLGTALNDPIAGVGRLRRIGISFGETQKQMIKQFMDQNDIMSAQRVILDELKVEFGGVSREIGESALGQFDRLKREIEDINEKTGKMLLPTVRDLNKGFLLAASGIEKFVDIQLKAAEIAGRLSAGQSFKQIRAEMIDRRIIAERDLGKILDRINEIMQQRMNLQASINKLEKEGIGAGDLREQVAWLRLRSEELIRIRKEFSVDKRKKDPVKPDLTDEQVKERFKANELFRKQAEEELKKFETEAKTSAQRIVEQRRLMRDLELSLIQDKNMRELAMTQEKHLREIEDFEGKEDTKTIMLQRQLIERQKAEEKYRKGLGDEITDNFKHEQKVAESRTKLAFSTARSLNMATQQIISATAKETKARQVALAALTMAEGISMSVRAASEAWKSRDTGEFYQKLATSIAVAASTIASTVAAVSSIRSQSFQSGTRNAPGGQSQIGEAGMELAVSPRRGALQQGSVVFNNKETKEILKGDTLVFNFAPGTNQQTIDDIEDLLLNAERTGRLENFKQVIRQ